MSRMPSFFLKEAFQKIRGKMAIECTYAGSADPTYYAEA